MFVPEWLGLYAVLLAFKAWVILSLGFFWTTRIIRIPRTPLVKRGPYRFIKHPNYVIVIAEIVVIPLAFHLYYTAIIFTALNAVMLSVRVSAENRALQQ